MALSQSAIEQEFGTWEVSAERRVKVVLRCKDCGELYTLRAVRDEKNKLETSFRMCLCGNKKRFDITPFEGPDAAKRLAAYQRLMRKL